MIRQIREAPVARDARFAAAPAERVRIDLWELVGDGDELSLRVTNAAHGEPIDNGDGSSTDLAGSRFAGSDVGDDPSDSGQPRARHAAGRNSHLTGAETHPPGMRSGAGPRCGTSRQRSSAACQN